MVSRITKVGVSTFPFSMSTLFLSNEIVYFLYHSSKKYQTSSKKILTNYGLKSNMHNEIFYTVSQKFASAMKIS